MSPALLCPKGDAGAKPLPNQFELKNIYLLLFYGCVRLAQFVATQAAEINTVYIHCIVVGVSLSVRYMLSAQSTTAAIKKGASQLKLA